MEKSQQLIYFWRKKKNRSSFVLLVLDEKLLAVSRPGGGGLSGQMVAGQLTGTGSSPTRASNFRTLMGIERRYLLKSVVLEMFFSFTSRALLVQLY